MLLAAMVLMNITMDVRIDKDENDQSYRSSYEMFSNDKRKKLSCSDKSYLKDINIKLDITKNYKATHPLHIYCQSHQIEWTTR